MTTKIALTAKEAAAAIGVSVNQLYKLRKQGLKSFLIGGSRRFTPEDIRAFMEDYRDEVKG
jgi:excisionase family DNA binding protein|tara:strand:+ start:2552 stop:2734 length:183 start_codon:yes stop_codon:yes gene_type:complete